MASRLPDSEAGLKKSRAEASSILAKYPNRVPLICHRAPDESELPDVGRKKMLLPSAMPCKELAGHILQHVNKAGAGEWEESQICVEVGGAPTPLDVPVSVIYQERKSEDLFLYATYSRARAGAEAATSARSRAAVSPSAAAAPSVPAAPGDCAEVRRIKAKHPDRVPAICDRATASDLPIISKKKFLLPGAMCFSEFAEVVKKQLCETAGEESRLDRGFYLSVASARIDGTMRMSEVYGTHRAGDGFLYVIYDVDRGDAGDASVEDGSSSSSSQLCNQTSGEQAAAEEAREEPEAAGQAASVAGASKPAVPMGVLEEVALAAEAMDEEIQAPQGTVEEEEEEEAAAAPGVVDGESQAEAPPLPEEASEAPKAEAGASPAEEEPAPPPPPAPRQLPTMLGEVERMLAKHPDRVPVLCERVPRSELPQIAPNRFLVPGTMRCSELKYIIHREVNKTGVIAGGQTIYLFIGSASPKTSVTMMELYDRFKSSSGFLHVTYGVENTLGT